jgi:Flp pilus assembly protein TadG
VSGLAVFRRDQRGQTSIEFLGMLPWLLLAALIVWQILLASYTATSATNAARTASRVAGLGGDGERAGLSALPNALDGGARVAIDGERASVEVRVPVLIPGVDTGAWTVTKTAELPGG